MLVLLLGPTFSPVQLLPALGGFEDLHALRKEK